MATKNALLDEFLTKSSELTQGAPDQRSLLSAFIDWLKERGQYVDGTDLKTQFVEKTTVLDKKGIQIEVDRCLVCLHQTYEVHP
jgi:hypothetical protein